MLVIRDVRGRSGEKKRRREKGGQKRTGEGWSLEGRGSGDEQRRRRE